jgi:signal peptidase I
LLRLSNAGATDKESGESPAKGTGAMKTDVISELGRPAGFWSRFWAKLADLMVMNVVQFVLVLPMPVLHVLGVPGLWLVSLFGLMAAAWVAYFAYYTSGGRQTLGYRLAGLRAMRTDDQPLGPWRALWRALLNSAFFGLTSGWAIGIVGYLPIAFTRSKRGLHDMLSGAKVVRVAESRRRALALCVVLCVLVPVIAVFAIVRPFFLQAFYIPSRAMEPTLRMDDRVLVNKLYYRVRSPERGDIAVFLAPKGASIQRPNVVFIKRIVGLPGDTIEIKGGKLYLNGRPLREDYIAKPMVYEMVAVKVPPGTVFVMGDNRNDSNDSHRWGPLPIENLRGKAMLAYPDLRGVRELGRHARRKGTGWSGRA